jgi:hypothetical protein
MQAVCEIVVVPLYCAWRTTDSRALGCAPLPLPQTWTSRGTASHPAYDGHPCAGALQYDNDRAPSSHCMLVLGQIIFNAAPKFIHDMR